MRPRRELAIGVGIFVLFGVLILAESLSTKTGTLDPRLSTYRSEPNGARAWADAAARLGHPLTRWRRPFTALPADPDSGTVLALLAPDAWLDFEDQRRLTRWVDAGGDLLLVGEGTRLLMACEGWRMDSLPTPGVTARGDVGDVVLEIPAVRIRLSALVDSALVDSSRSSDLGMRSCPRRPRGFVDTLLRAPSGAPLAIRITRKRGPTITLVGDPTLFTNRALRESAAGEFTLALLRPGPTAVLVDEYHHDYGTGRSLAGAILAWSAGSPFGWILWQAVAVGLIALVASMVRLGPIRPLPAADRRSPLEHVTALARTLAASRGHDVAVLTLVRGLRRRLSADGRPARDDPKAWLRDLQGRVRGGAARRAVARLIELTRPGRDTKEVLAAANAVEEIWQDLRP